VEEKFSRVSMPEKFERRIAEHEVLMSFYDDEAAYAFREWWEDEGSALFQKFCGAEDVLEFPEL
jgi:hypothetical protein